MPARTIRSLVAVAGILILGSCSVSVGGGKLDTAKLQNEISTEIQQQTGVTVDSVSCPEGIDAKQGTTFDCTATAGGDSVTVNVDVTDDDGNVHWKLAP